METASGRASIFGAASTARSGLAIVGLADPEADDAQDGVGEIVVAVLDAAILIDLRLEERLHVVLDRDGREAERRVLDLHDDAPTGADGRSVPAHRAPARRR